MNDHADGKRQVSRSYATLLVFALSVLLFATSIRFTPFVTGYSPCPASFYGGGAQYVTRCIDEGRLLEGSDFGELNSFGGQVQGAISSKMFVTYVILFQELTNLDTTAWSGLIAFSMSVCLFLMISVISILRRILREKSERASLVGYSYLIIPYAVLASPIFISLYLFTNAAIAYSIICLLFGLLLFKRGNSRIASVVLFLSVFICIFYFSAATVYVVFLAIVIGVMFIRRRVSRPSFLALMVVTTVTWLSFSAFIDLTRFTSIVNMSDGIVTLLRGEFQVSNPSYPVLKGYLASTSSENKIRLLLNAICVSIPILMFSMREFRSRNSYRNPQHEDAGVFAMSFAIALIILVFLFYLWLGTLGINRIADYGTLGSIIVMPVLVSQFKSRKILGTFAVLITLTISSSAYAYLMDENHGVASVTIQEAEGILWLSSNGNHDGAVFTDLRLSGTLVWQGFLNTTGIDERLYPASEVILLLESVYYNGALVDVSAVHDTAKYVKCSRINYIVISHQMSENVPGIRGYDFPYKPAPPEFTDRFHMTPSIDLIMSNGDLEIYYCCP